MPEPSRRIVMTAGAVALGLLPGCSREAVLASDGRLSPTGGEPSGPGAATTSGPPTASTPTTRRASAGGSSPAAAATSAQPSPTKPSRTASPTRTPTTRSAEPTPTTAPPTVKPSRTPKPTKTTSTRPPEPVDVQLSEISVGGAVVRNVGGRQVVFSRPSSGTIVAFDARCTHKGCPVQPGGGRLECPCHGSAFATSSGAVLVGPADAPLARLGVRMHDGGASLT